MSLNVLSVEWRCSTVILLKSGTFLVPYSFISLLTMLLLLAMHIYMMVWSDI